MSYFALLDSDSDNEASGAKIAVKKEPKDSKAKPAAASAPVKAAAVDTKVDTKQKENKSAPAANANKDVKKPKDTATGGDKKPVKKEASAGLQAVDPDVDAVKEKTSHADKEHGKTKRHTGAEGSYGGRGHQGGRGRGAGRGGDGTSAPRDEKPVDPSDHEHGLERAPRKREFDRKSSTGRTGEQRKGGRGPHSFGNEKQEGAEAEKNPASAEVEVEALEGAEVEGGEEGGVAVVEPVVPVVEEPKTFTYDEYLEKKKTESKVINKEVFAEPKAIRVVETSEFQGLKTVALEETVFMAKPVKSVTDKKVAPQRSVAKATTLDVAFKVVPAEDSSSAGESSYGGRGGGRGGRGGRGGDREGGSGRGRASAPSQSRGTGGGTFDLNSLAESFPSL